MGNTLLDNRLSVQESELRTAEDYLARRTASCVLKASGALGLGLVRTDLTGPMGRTCHGD